VRAQKKEEMIQKQKKNIYANNYVDTGDLEDFDDYKGDDKESKTIKIKYKMFHELPVKTRVDVLYYLCQTRLDQESPEFMQEVVSIQATHAKSKGVSLKPDKI
jgi:hypothetical protein